LAANQWLFGGLIEKQLSSNARTNALLRTTTAPTLLQAGIKTNVVSPTATGTVNFRLHPRDTPESVKAHVISAIDDERVEVDMRSGGMSSLASKVSSREGDGYRLIAQVARQIYGDLIVVPGMTAGGTDSKHYSRVADDSYRFQFMMVSPGDISGFHGTNERVAIENLVKGTGAYYLLLKEAAGGH
jgi:carboxypeptidase PM20D1